MYIAKFLSIFFFVCLSTEGIHAAEKQENPFKKAKATIISKGFAAELKTSQIKKRPGLTQEQMNLRHQLFEQKRNAYMALRNKTNQPNVNPQNATSKALLPQNILKANNFQTKDLALSPNFLAGTLAESGFIPPDGDGYVGTKQYIVCLNGLIKSFRKNGKADGVLDLSTTSFFSSVISDIPGYFTYTSDPRIIFDKPTKRWFITMDDVSLNNVGYEFPDNKVLLAVSDGKHDGEITGDTVWSFYSFHPGTIRPQSDWFVDFGYIADSPTLGIDRHALYMGLNVFSFQIDFLTSDLFVINKEALLKEKKLKITPFRDFVNPHTGLGMFDPQGVTNFDKDAKEGFFVGADFANLSTLHMRRIIRPGSDSPSISKDITMAIPITAQPLFVPAKGSVNAIDANDNRLDQAHIRNKKLYTSQTIAVNNKGRSGGSVDRDGSRWYEFSLANPGKPELIQVGTLHDPTDTLTPLSYFFPSVMTNKHHTMILGCTVAGANAFLNAAVTYRHADDEKGFLHKVRTYTHSTTAYNVQNVTPQRWGDYSISSPDPDDESLWTCQEYCNDTNSWGVRVGRLHKKHDRDHETSHSHSK